MPFKLTYSTMFDPPPELHEGFERALAVIRANLGGEHPMLIGGRDVRAPRQFAVHSPIIRYDNQRAVRAVLAKKFGEFLNYLVGKGVGQNDSIEPAFANSRAGLLEGFRCHDRKPTVLQHGRAIQREFTDATVHEYPVPLRGTPGKPASIGKLRG